MSSHLPMSSSNKSIAVLPFVNMSTSAENEYFSDGITEEIINALTTVKGLKVIARTSSFAFKGKNVDVRMIGRQLGVATILEGSVRKAKNRVRITAQLVNTEDGVHLWSKNFDRELADIFALQDEVSLLIADQIRENYGHIEIKDHLVKAPTKNVEAYNLFLKGRYHQLKWNGEGIREGIKYYKQCIAIDANYSLAYFGIGYCYAMFGSWGSQKENLEIADNYLKKGFQLDNQSYLGFFGKATLSFWGKWNFKKSHRYFKNAIALNSSYTEAEEGLAELYTALGHFKKAQHHVQNVLAINPLSPNHYFTKGNIYFLSQNFHKALECMKMARQIDPNFLHAIEFIQLCYIQLKDYQKLNDFLNTNPLAERPELCRALYKLVHPDEAITFDLEAIQAKINDKTEVTLLPWPLFLHVHLGNMELALDILETAVENRQGQYINFKNIPLLNPLHGHQRFEKLVQITFPTTLLPKEKDLDKSLFRKKENKNLISEEELTTILKQLEQFMEVENLFTEATLSLRQLAQKLNLNPNKLSWLLNTHIGKNFNEYINSCRLATFKKKALDPANSHLTLLGLAYESGFNSKTVFNSFFKKMEGITPRAWVKLKS